MKIKKIKTTKKERVRLGKEEREKRNVEIMQEYNKGKSITQLSKEYDMSYVFIRYIVKSAEKVVPIMQTQDSGEVANG